MPNKPPNHLTEEVFRAYEKHIFSIVSKFPLRVTFDPKPLSAKTFAARLRDAIRSHRIYKWTSVVDPKVLEDIRGPLCIIEEGGLVVATRRSDARPEVGVEIEPLLTMGSTTVIREPTETDFWAVAWLLSRKIIPGPFQFHNVPAAWLTKLDGAPNYDVAVKTDGNITTMI